MLNTFQAMNNTNAQVVLPQSDSGEEPEPFVQRG